MSRAIPLLALFLVGCANPRVVQRTLNETEQALERAHAIHARLCAPEELAQAEANLTFARIESKQGYVRRGGEHANLAKDMAFLAVESSTPCGTSDRDMDLVADIVDRCPDEPEDHDGVDDLDGCRDIVPTGDEDGDGIINIDDACLDEPEDVDGDADEDGCPETSEDRDGDGIIDAIDQCDDEAEDLDGFNDQDGCPEPDDDADGVLDIHDHCPKIPEDPDDWEDDDGCPDADNDGDGIPDAYDECRNQAGDRMHGGCPETDGDRDGIADADDRCPDQPETVNNYLDEDGCPDTPPRRVKVTRSRIEITETVQFATGSAEVLGASFPVLDDVAQVLLDAPQMRLRIEGHTDSEGGEASNQRLSERRAASVLAYLTSRGIAAGRVTSVGLGETSPIDTNRTSAGRARNRRVEFHIVE